jgi:hypothetical protein
MKHLRDLSRIPIGLASMVVLVAAAAAQQQQQQRPTVAIPNPGVPEIATLEGQFVRVAYNNEGYVSLGYRIANDSVGQEWMLLEIGTTLREGTPTYTMTRQAISLETPDGRTIPLATNAEYQAGDVRALDNRANAMRDSLNYFPPSASEACRIGFFAELGRPAMAYDKFELTSRRACGGRLYFRVPGAIQYGQHWLNVKFQQSLVRVPFRILTDEEEKLLSRSWKDIRKQVEEAFKVKR